MTKEGREAMATVGLMFASDKMRLVLIYAFVAGLLFGYIIGKVI